MPTVWRKPVLNDRTTARLVEKNCLAHRLFTTASTPPPTDASTAAGEPGELADGAGA
jgi:hypothetical protein